MRVLSVVAALVALLALSTSVSAQSSTTTTSFAGYATCNFTTMQQTITRGAAIVQMLGYLTVNLTAGAYVHPNTPGFPAGTTFLSYPIIDMGGIRKVYNSSIKATGFYQFDNINGVGADRLIYMTFDPSQSAGGYPNDVGYQYRFDMTGITILTNNTDMPDLQFAEINASGNNQYSELDLWAAGGWNPASFQLSTCTANYTIVTDVTPADPSSAVGDPAFTGFLGQRFQIHGMADTVYNIISDASVQLNAMFVFLSHGECPVVDGKRMTNCWSHPGSYFGSLALQTADGDRLLITAGSHKDGFTMTLNDQPLSSSVSRAGLSVAVDNSFRVLIEAGLYRMAIENSDMFLNIAGIEVTDWQQLKATVQPHGLLGQTWRGRRSVAVEGSVDDYAEADNSMFGNAFLFNKFDKRSSQ